MSVTSVITSRVAIAARLRRHERVFGKNSIFVHAFKKSHHAVLAAGNHAATYTGLKFASHIFADLKAKHQARVVAPTAATLYKRLAVLTVGILSVTTVLGSTFDVSYAQYNDEYFSQISQEGTLIADQDGYFTKANPQTTQMQRSFKDVAQYSVDTGDNLSLIAQRFNIKSETLMWENGLTLTSVLRIGQKLNIPPANGVSHRVATGQSVEKIAALYKVDTQKIVAMNSLQNGVITQGQIIFVPDAKPLPAASPVARTIARASGRDAPARNIERTNLSDSSSTPSAGKFMIFPTVGVLTQGFKSGHYAYDIANRSQPPIWAAAGGKVVTATMGTWAGGYGNHVVVDHGNGVKTLYAHMSYTSVNVGDEVTQGQVVGRMGNSGRVRGATGIHLHFEVIDHGVKKTPSRYY